MLPYAYPPTTGIQRRIIGAARHGQYGRSAIRKIRSIPEREGRTAPFFTGEDILLGGAILWTFFQDGATAGRRAINDNIAALMPPLPPAPATSPCRRTRISRSLPWRGGKPRRAGAPPAQARSLHQNASAGISLMISDHYGRGEHGTGTWRCHACFCLRGPRQDRGTDTNVFVFLSLMVLSHH